MTTTPRAPASVPAPGHRPELDGIRGVAVLLVVAFHSGLRAMSGGFIGVDVFFVLSGFLITGLIVDDHRGGTFSIAEFYSRRARRLLPAALVVIAAISLTWMLTSSVIERAPIQKDATAAALYFSNWRFAATSTNYFAAGDSPSPFLHFWSLSAEEQFYLAWPIVIAMVFAVHRRRHQRHRGATARASTADGLLLGVIAALTFASVASLTWASTTGHSAIAYFGTQNRVYQLLAGATLAVLARRRTRAAATSRWDGAVQGVAFGALLLAATSVASVGATVRGVWTAAATTTLLWALGRRTTTATARVLMHRATAYVGRISYGIYLWHWPTILVLRRFQTTNAGALFGLATFISVVLAAASAALLEQPIRRSTLLGRHRRWVLGIGTTASLAMGALLAPAMLEATVRPVFVAASATRETPAADENGAAVDPLSTTPSPSLAHLQLDHPDGFAVPCLPGGPTETCLVHHGSSGRTLLVIGDSHLGPFRTTFAQFGAKYDLTVNIWLATGCPWEDGLVVLGGSWVPECITRQRQLYDIALPSMRPDVVLVMNDAYDDVSYPRTIGVGPDSTPTDPVEALTTALPTAIPRMMTFTHQLVIVRPWPSLEINQRECLATVTYVGQCSVTAHLPLPSDHVLESTVALTPGVSMVDLRRSICPRLPICDAMVDGEVVRRDRDHLDYRFVPHLESELERQLLRIGVLRPR